MPHTTAEELYDYYYYYEGGMALYDCEVL